MFRVLGIYNFAVAISQTHGSHDKLVWQLIDFQCLGQEVRVEIRH